MHKMFALLKGLASLYFDSFGGGTLLDLNVIFVGDKELPEFNNGSGDNFSYKNNFGYGHGNSMGSSFGNGYGDGYDHGNCYGDGSSSNSHFCLKENDA